MNDDNDDVVIHLGMKKKKERTTASSASPQLPRHRFPIATFGFGDQEKRKGRRGDHAIDIIIIIIITAHPAGRRSLRLGKAGTVSVSVLLVSAGQVRPSGDPQRKERSKYPCRREEGGSDIVGGTVTKVDTHRHTNIAVVSCYHCSDVGFGIADTDVTMSSTRSSPASAVLQPRFAARTSFLPCTRWEEKGREIT